MRNSLLRIIGAIAALSGLVGAASAAAPPVYSLTDLGTFGGTITVGRAMNERGQVTGYSYTAGNAAYHAFLYSNGALTDLGTFGGTFSAGLAINERGQVTGFANTARDRKSVV